jgi:hypothetical protein
MFVCFSSVFLFFWVIGANGLLCVFPQLRPSPNKKIKFTLCAGTEKEKEKEKEKETNIDADCG